MATARGHQGLLGVPDADPGTNNQQDHLLHHLVNESTKPFSVSYTVNSPAQQDTGFASTVPVVHSFRSDDLKDWSALFEAYYPKAAPVSGHLGNVTFANGTDNKVESYSLTFQQEEFDDTGMAATPPEWRDYQPGLWQINGTYRGRVDSVGAITLGTRGAATFRLSTATLDNTIAVNITITSVSKAIQIGSQVFVDYGFQVEDQATSAGTNTLMPAGVLTEPELTYVTIRSVGSRVESGYCFVSGLTVNVAVGQPITVSGTLRGSGELTAA